LLLLQYYQPTCPIYQHAGSPDPVRSDRWACYNHTIIKTWYLQTYSGKTCQKILTEHSSFPSTANRDSDLQDSITTAFILEEYIQHTVTLLSYHSVDYHSTFTPELKALTDFYSIPELWPNQVKFANNSLSQQIHQPESYTSLSPFTNSFHFSSTKIFKTTTWMLMTTTLQQFKSPPRK